MPKGEQRYTGAYKQGLGQQSHSTFILCITSNLKGIYEEKL